MSNDRKFPTEVIDLPSHGWFYDPQSPLASGRIELKYMTAREEDILTSRNLIAKGVVLDKLLQALVVDKSIDYGQLLTGDKNGIMIAARVLAYGKDYKTNVTCRVCGKVTQTAVDLTQLNEKKVPEPETRGINEFTYKLPLSSKVIKFKLLTHADDAEIQAELDKSNGPDSEVDHTLSTRLKYIIMSINGNTDKQVIRDFVDNQFLALDARSFREHYFSVNPDVDMTFLFVCSNSECKNERRLAVPLGVDFFWPDAGV